MLHKNCLYVFTVILTIISLLFNLGIKDVMASPGDTISPEGYLISTQIKSPFAQAEDEPEAWLDETIDQEQFGTMSNLVIHFNTAMLPASAPNPILSWPVVEGTDLPACSSAHLANASPG